MVDLLMVVLVVGAGILGWRRGLLVSLAAGVVFLIAGIPVAAIVAVTGIMPPVAGFMLGGLLGLVPVALRLDSITGAIDGVFAGSRWKTADRAAGALLNVGVAVCLAWFIGALASIVPADSGTLVRLRDASTLGALVESVPPQGSLGVLVLRSGLVPGVNGPLVLAEPPDPASATTPAVVAARASVLQVRSTACRSIVTGTGWVAGPGLVITNAHVVAGSEQSFLAGGPDFDGTRAIVTAFDPVNDVAVLVLAERGVALPAALPLTPRVEHGEPAAVIGYPLGGRQAAQPARIDRVAEYPVEPLGGGTEVAARILAFRAAVQSGNSGGPILAEDGSVLGLVVSKGLGQRIDAAYGVASSDLLPIIAEGSRREPVETGPCLEEEDLRSGKPQPARPQASELPGGVAVR